MNLLESRNAPAGAAGGGSAGGVGQKDDVVWAGMAAAADASRRPWKRG